MQFVSIILYITAAPELNGQFRKGDKKGYQHSMFICFDRNTVDILCEKINNIFTITNDVISA